MRDFVHLFFEIFIVKRQVLKCTVFEIAHFEISKNANLKTAKPSTTGGVCGENRRTYFQGNHAMFDNRCMCHPSLQQPELPILLNQFSFPSTTPNHQPHLQLKFRALDRNQAILVQNHGRMRFELDQ